MQQTGSQPPDADLSIQDVTNLGNNWAMTCRSCMQRQSLCMATAENQNCLFSETGNNHVLTPCDPNSTLDASSLNKLTLPLWPWNSISCESPPVLLPWPRCGSLNRTSDQPLASCLGWLTQLRLSLSGSLLLSLTVNKRCPRPLRQVWGRPHLGPLLVCDSLFEVKVHASLHWSLTSSSSFSGH